MPTRPLTAATVFTDHGREAGNVESGRSHAADLLDPAGDRALVLVGLYRLITADRGQPFWRRESSSPPPRAPWSARPCMYQDIVLKRSTY
jgi:hypothetical protein